MNNCGDEIRKSLKNILGEEKAAKINEAIIRNWTNQVERLSKGLDDGTLTFPQFSKAIDEEIEKVRLSAEISASLKAKDVLAKAKVTNFVRQPGFKGSEAEGFKAYLTKTYKRGNNAAVSIEGLHKARLIMYSDILEQGLHNHKLVKVFESGQLDEQIYKAYAMVEEGKFTPVEGVSKEAITIASEIKKMNDLMFSDMTLAKMPVLRKKNRVTMQTHSQDKMRSMGKDKWVQTVSELGPELDFLPAIAKTPDGLREVLNEMYDDILLGKYADIDPDASLVGISDGDSANASVGSAKVGKRHLNFNPENSYKYNQMFGVYDNLMSTLMADVQRTALKTTLFDTLGDRPEPNMGKAITLEVARLKKEGNLKAAEKLEGERPAIMNMVRSITKANNIPANPSWAKAEKVIAGAEVGSKLGNVGFRSFSNTANTASAITSATGENYLSALIKSVVNIDLKDAAQRTWATETGNLLDRMSKKMMADIDGGGVPGMATKLASFMMKYNGQDFLNNAFSESVQHNIISSWAKNMDKTFDSLNSTMRADLLSAGIGKQEWEVLKLAQKPLSNKQNFLDFDLLDMREKPVRQAVEKLMAEKGLKGNPDKILLDMKLGLGSYFSQKSSMASTAPGVRERSTLMGASQTGTAEGFAKSTFMRFKSFSVQSYLTSRSIINSGVDEEALAQGFAKSSDSGNYKHLAAFMLTTTGLAYLADTLIRAGQGKEAKDPKDPKTWLDALAKSSAGGLYLDVFNGEWDRYSFATALAGPTFGQLDPLASAVTNIGQGLTEKDPKKSKKGYTDAAEDVTKVVRSYMPFQQAVGVKLAFDHVQYRMIKEALNPVSNARYDAKQAREKLKKQLQGD